MLDPTCGLLGARRWRELDAAGWTVGRTDKDEELSLLRMTQKAAREYRNAEMQMFRTTGAEQRDELRGDLNRAQETLDRLLKVGGEA